MSLEGKSIFITGGTGGIGAPLVRLLREAGAEVEAYDIETQGDLVANLDGICESLRANPPDILINLAGCNAFDYCENQDLQALVTLNLMVPMRLTQAVLPGMKARNSGQVVTMGSMTAVIPLPHVTAYVAAKAGLKGFTDALRRELGGSGIALTHILPRAVKTPMNAGAQAIVNERTHVTCDDPEDVARWIFQAIRARKREVRFGWPERLFAFLNASLPGLIDQGLQKNCRIGEEVLDNR